jgi:ABC-type phosphate/phosphonate transport system permease subunit
MRCAVRWRHFLRRILAARDFGPRLPAPSSGRPLWETLAMSLLGTLLAARGRSPAGACPPAAMRRGTGRWPACVLNALRAIPELVWAALLLILAGLGPLCRHAGAGGAHQPACWAACSPRRWKTRKRRPSAPADTLRALGARRRAGLFAYATLPTVLPQLHQLLPLPLGKQHPRRRGAGRCRCRRPGPAAGLSHGPLST